ncbi:ABC transporter ATP-binding protein [Niameybacter sp.]|uniref:ABC transporter ATP-binding protein n=1 Tax=Niameybacter sp. TaxID=2033640 RepID=UPI002FC9ACCF
MKYFYKMPWYVEEAFVQRGIKIDRLLYCAKADLDEEGCYIDVHMTFDVEHLYILKGYEKIDEEKFEVCSYESLPMSEITNVSIYRYSTTAVLLMETKNEERPLVRFSLGMTDTFEKFKERLLKTKNHEAIDDTLLEGLHTHCPVCHTRYPNQERKVCPNCLDKQTTFKRLLKKYLDYKKEFVTVMLMITLSTVFNLIAPYFSTRLLYDEVLTDGGSWYGKITLIVILIALVKLIGVILSMVYGLILARITPKITRDIKVEIFSKLQTLPVSFFSSKQTGSLMTRVENDAMNIYWFFVDVLPYGIVSFVTIVGLLGIMLWISVEITLVMFGSVILITIILKEFRMKQRKLWRRRHRAVKGTQAVVSESLNGQRVVKAFAKEDEEIRRYDEKNKDFYHVSYQIGNRTAYMMPKVRFIARFSNVAVLAIGAFSIIFGSLTLGSLYILFSYTGMIESSVMFFANIGNRWANCMDAAARMFEIIDTVPTLTESENPVALDGIRDSVELKEVSFEYEVGRPIIKEISLKVKAGQMFGIVGKTGAGKSTIIHLISRLYDPTNGEILIDGINVKEIKNHDLRRHVGIVSQETYLFVGTIADNIRYANPDATMDQIIEAAKAAYAHEFIVKQPDAYDTIIGAGGVGLSGGERQRLSIARAILQKPSVLILDEATSAMDTQTERKIQEAIDELKEGRTIIAIAHRLSTLRDADQLAVIEDGKLLEQGTHEELIAKEGKYYDLYQLQAEAIKFMEEGSIGV